MSVNLVFLLSHDQTSLGESASSGQMEAKKNGIFLREQGVHDTLGTRGSAAVLRTPFYNDRKGQFLFSLKSILVTSEVSKTHETSLSVVLRKSCNDYSYF